jgi:hypothetical protein
MTELHRITRPAPDLLAPKQPRQTDDGAAVKVWKESRSRRPEHGLRLPLSDTDSHAGAVSECPREHPRCPHQDPILHSLPAKSYTSTAGTSAR